MFLTIAKKSGGKAFTTPIEVYLDQYNIYQPDVLYLIPNTTCKIEEKRLTGAPDLVVEVLSPSTAKVDRLQKYEAYEQHGVSEYWIVDPAHHVIEVWNLIDGRYKRQGAYATDDNFMSATLNQLVDVKSIFAE